MQEQIILGGLEEVRLLDFNLTVTAKIDTGAYSGALHCVDIKTEEQDGETVLLFRPLSYEEPLVEFKDFKEVIVRSSHGHERSRYLIPIKLEMNGKEYRTTIGLSDRTAMKRDMLLGRRFLMENNAVVDVNRTKHLDQEAKNFPSSETIE